jgi:UDP-MurNAc hydroxylase
MRLQFATNASFLIALESGIRLLTDPWYSEGVYYGSWYNYPPLSELQRRHFIRSTPHFIYISHLHPDHLDPRTLAEYDKHIPILIGKLPHGHLLRTLRKIGFSDIRELPLGEISRVGELDICILPQFEGTSDGTVDDVDYAIDTSFFLRDANGETLLHVVDNPIKPEHATRLRKRFGTIDVAILPYSGASFFPHAFSALSDSQKTEQTDRLRETRLALLLEVATALRPKWVIPAAGSYVMGGRLARYNRYLHQATPAQLAAFWNERSTIPSKLTILAPGDTLLLPEGNLCPDSERDYVNFSEENRCAHGVGLSELPLPQDEIKIPSDFVIPWRRLLEKARRHLWTIQQTTNLFPAVDIEIQLISVTGCPVQDNEHTRFRFSLDCCECNAKSPVSVDNQTRPFICFRLDSSLMLMVLVGAAVWNNIEIGALVECERQPDIYTPTVHSLMSFFTL